MDSFLIGLIVIGFVMVVVGVVYTVVSYSALLNLLKTKERPKTLEDPKDITDEAWREYSFCGGVYRILDPAKLFWAPGSTTHRVVDTAGITHCVPAPGTGDCVLRWESKDKNKPVSF